MSDDATHHVVEAAVEVLSLGSGHVASACDYRPLVVAGGLSIWREEFWLLRFSTLVATILKHCLVSSCPESSRRSARR